MFERKYMLFSLHWYTTIHFSWCDFSLISHDLIKNLILILSEFENRIHYELAACLEFWFCTHPSRRHLNCPWESELFGENKMIKFPNEHAYQRCKCSMLLYCYAKSGLFIMSYTKYNLFMYIICHKYLCYWEN